MAIQQTTPPEARALLARGYRYIDVRTEAEFANGHPEGAVNIPVVFIDPATRQMNPNPEFVAVVAANFPKDTALVIGCQAGARSQKAAELLEAAGYTKLVNMQGGYGGARDQSGRTIVPGWHECDLPVSTVCGPGETYATLRAAVK